MKHRLEQIQKTLIECVECQMCHLENVDTKELGEAMDMIKDLSETLYYHTITEAMHKDKEHHVGKEWDNDGSAVGPVVTHYGARHDGDYPMRDHREGRSPLSRKAYLESKHMHKDNATTLQHLEKYLQELTMDMLELVEDASVEEKQHLHKHLSMLTDKMK